MRAGLGFALVAASPAAAGPADAASEIWPQPQEYSAHLSYDARHAVLAGRERITFLNDGPDWLSSVWLRVWPNGYGSCRRPYARVRVTGGGVASGWKVGCTVLRVGLSHPISPGASGSVAVRLRVKVPKNADRFGRVGSTVYLGNALPLLDIEDSSGASVEPYTNLGDPFYSRVARWSVTLDVPDSLVAATTGTVTSRGSAGSGMTRIGIAAAEARDFAIVLGHFSVESTVTAGGVRLVHYRQSGARRSVAMRDLKAARADVEQTRPGTGSGSNVRSISPPGSGWSTQGSL